MTDLRNKKVGYKNREHTLERIPYLVVTGDRERAEHTVTVCSVNGDDLGSMTLAEFSDVLRRKPDVIRPSQ